MAFSRIGNNIAGLVLGEAVGMVSQNLTNRINIQRNQMQIMEKMSTPNSVPDLAFTVFTNMIFITLGIGFVERGVPAITGDMSTMFFFLLGVLSQTQLGLESRQLTKLLFSTPSEITSERPVHPDISKERIPTANK